MLFGSKLIVFFAVTAATITDKFGKNYKNFGYQKSFPFVLAEFLFDDLIKLLKDLNFYFFLLRSMNNLEAMLLLSFA
jgi:hypothetical protein